MNDLMNPKKIKAVDLINLSKGREGLIIKGCTEELSEHIEAVTSDLNNSGVTRRPVKSDVLFTESYIYQINKRLDLVLFYNEVFLNREKLKHWISNLGAAKLVSDLVNTYIVYAMQ